MELAQPPLVVCPDGYSFYVPFPGFWKVPLSRALDLLDGNINPEDERTIRAWLRTRAEKHEQQAKEVRGRGSRAQKARLLSDAKRARAAAESADIHVASDRMAITY